MAWSVKVVFPDDSGPKISTTRPRGIPPIPKAMSSPREPVEITGTSAAASAVPNFMTAPLPYCFSICASAKSNARFLSSFSGIKRLLYRNNEMNQPPLLREAHLVFRHHHWLFEEVFRRLSRIFKTLGAHRLAPVRRSFKTQPAHRLAGAHRPGALYSSHRAPHYSSRRGPREAYLVLRAGEFNAPGKLSLTQATSLSRFRCCETLMNA